jgi:hypothetical protein
MIIKEAVNGEKLTEMMKRTDDVLAVVAAAI